MTTCSHGMAPDVCDWCQGIERGRIHSAEREVIAAAREWQRARREWRPYFAEADLLSAALDRLDEVKR